MRAYLLMIMMACAGQASPANHIWTAAERKLEADQATLWTETLTRAAALQPKDKFDALWLGLRNMGYRTARPGHSVVIDQIFGEIQHDFLATPGHAQYFADLIEAERAALKPADFRGAYDRNRRMYLAETLCHLPSPETVKVLGFYLYDERDDPPPGAAHSSDVIPEPTTAIQVMRTLTELGIRGAPFPQGTFFHRQDWDNLARFRAWFAPIKAGEKAFSFQGQAVEYRFKPDGTWTSTPIAHPPDDTPKPPLPTAPPRPHPAQATTPQAGPAATGHAALWPWLLGVALLVLPAAAWFLKARRRP